MIYTIRFYGPDGAFMSNTNIHCKDDAEARHIFEKIKREYTIDLWQGQRMIARADAERQADGQPSRTNYVRS
jgi:hypothetical protein